MTTSCLNKQIRKPQCELLLENKKQLTRVIVIARGSVAIRLMDAFYTTDKYHLKVSECE